MLYTPLVLCRGSHGGRRRRFSSEEEGKRGTGKERGHQGKLTCRIVYNTQIVLCLHMKKAPLVKVAIVERRTVPLRRGGSDEEGVVSTVSEETVAKV